MGKTCFASHHWIPGVSCWCLKWLGPWAEREAGQAKGFSLGAHAGETVTTQGLRTAGHQLGVSALHRGNTESISAHFRGSADLLGQV